MKILIILCFANFVSQIVGISRCEANLSPDDPNDSMIRFDAEGGYGQSLASGANDVVAVRQSNGNIAATPIHVQIGKLSSWRTIFSSRQGRRVQIIINGEEFFPDAKFSVVESGNACFDRPENQNTLTSEELQRMNLRFGQNDGAYVVDSIHIEIPFSIFLLDQSSRLVLTDIDGTITESNIKGLVFPQFGIEAHQENVIELFQKIAANNYTVVYLTARSMAHDGATRRYLFQSLQDYEGFSLPPGPLFMSPLSFTPAVVEAIVDASVTKANTLRELIDLFDRRQDVVYGAYGNANTDTIAYLEVGIRPDLIFLVNKSGQLRHVGDGTITSYGEQANRTDIMYPI